MTGVLTGIRVIELSGVAPAPFACMMLADHGADVLRIERLDSANRTPEAYGADILARGRRVVHMDLKNEEALRALLRLIESADVLVEGFRPGVAERMGFGPDVCCARNPGLIYGRITGWGQSGPNRNAAGHDINFIALSGVLHQIGPDDRPPTIPLNLVGDFGGGGLLLAFGIVCALFERETSGLGQVIDAAMVDGAALLGSYLYGIRRGEHWSEQRGVNRLDGGAHFYNTYETADGSFISIGSVEPKFYEELLRRVDIADEQLPSQMDRSQWPTMKERFAELFRSRTRSEWCEILEGTDSCFAPVLAPAEAHEHPHLRARKTFVEIDGITQPAPAPRFERTVSSRPERPLHLSEMGPDALESWGIAAEELDHLRDIGAMV